MESITFPVILAVLSAAVTIANLVINLLIKNQVLTLAETVGRYRIEDSEKIREWAEQQFANKEAVEARFRALRAH